MNIVAIDTSTDWCGISLFIDGKCKELIEKYIPKKHSENLPLFFESLINKSDLKKNRLDAIAVSIGPGSFTGLRIGLGFSKGLAYALNKPIVPVQTLDVIGNHPDVVYNNFLALLYSHRNIVFKQKFLNKKSEGRPEACKFDEINLNNNIVQYGCNNLLGSRLCKEIHPSAEVVGELALRNFDLWKIDKPYSLTSNYISPFEIG
tara:strand:+ start:352 stop:963 length:612 start_codon:yes stop_codon:yes gene_type:complete